MLLFLKPVFPAELCDYEELSPTEITDSDAEIVLFTINDDIALEFNELIHVIYKPTHEYYVKDLEKKGEFFRDVATVRIMDNDSELSAHLVKCQTS